MFYVLPAIVLRIISNSYLNVFQKLLSKEGSKSSVINFFTYLGLSVIGFFTFKGFIFSYEIFITTLVMGFLGALGNYFIIKALSYGELSSLAPVNSYKPVVALIFGIFFLNEIPNIKAVFGILLIMAGSYFIMNKKGEILLQRRALTKKKNPGVWSKTGGHVDSNETIIDALKREVEEEVGTQIEDIEELGLTIEYRGEVAQLQISYGYKAKATGELKEPIYTQEEINDGFVLRWVPMHIAIEILKQDQPTNYIGKFIQNRDLELLMKADELFF